MNFGRFRHRVTIERATTTTDTYGELTETWAALGTFAAEVRTVAGREAELAKQLSAEATHQVRMRYNPEIAPPLSPADRLLFEGRTLEIEHVRPDVRKTELLLTCKESVA